MATAKGIIKRAMRLIHVLDGAEEPSAQEATDSLAALNSMLDNWSTRRLNIFAITQEALTWPASTTSRTIGSSGDFNTTRPIRIETSTFITYSSVDYPVKILDTRDAYSAITSKSTSGSLPEVLYYEPSFPLGVIYLYPVPSAAITLNLHSTTQLTQLAALTTTFSMPPGYDEAVTYSLAERLAPEFGVGLPPEVMKTGMVSRKAIKRANTPTPHMQVEVGVVGNSFYNIDSDSSR